MPWCPICKNEYKEGYEVCADCGCKLMDSIGEEMTAFFGPEKEADAIVNYLSENGIDYAYKKYNNSDGQYEVLIQKSKKEEIRPLMKKYFTEISPIEIPEMDAEEPVMNEPPVNIPRYKKPSERAAEYKSGAQTLLLVGIVGLIILVLVDIGLIPLALSGESKVLINIVMGGLFIIFVVVGLNSVKTYKKLVLQSGEDEALETSILEWFEKSVTLDMITSGENSKESEESLYFGRLKTIKDMIVSNFESVDPSFLEYISDKIYNNLFK
ncbi:MAG: hypothetical protein J5525_10925 [Lachnospiraceae bacterium]|nr:hypothetical protein [Lachnospiraceae bacterium]